MPDTPKTKSIKVDLDSDTHRDFKIYCIENDTSMTRWLEKQVLRLLEKETSRAAREGGEARATSPAL